MNKRLEQFLTAENISQSSFADSIGVARASVSHILAGRNKPGFDFIENMSKRYPTLNLEWLITGKGKMYKEANIREQNDYFAGSLFSQTEVSPSVPVDAKPSELVQPEELKPITVKSETVSTKIERIDEAVVSEKIPESVGKSIAKIIVFYTDNSFVELK